MIVIVILVLNGHKNWWPVLNFNQPLFKGHIGESFFVYDDLKILTNKLKSYLLNILVFHLWLFVFKTSPLIFIWRSINVILQRPPQLESWSWQRFVSVLAVAFPQRFSTPVLWSEDSTSVRYPGQFWSTWTHHSCCHIWKKYILF